MYKPKVQPSERNCAQRATNNSARQTRLAGREVTLTRNNKKLKNIFSG